MSYGKCRADVLGETITEYWDERAQSYSNGINGELEDSRRDVWAAALDKVMGGVLAEARADGRTPRVADLGCGPGFFSVLLAQMGCEVDAVDGSAGMVALARDNVSKMVPGGAVAFHERDLLSLPFSDGTFDACVCRNVTWLMREPVAAYVEWLRVLRPGGKLVAFDANWYRYLVDPEVGAKRRADQDGNVLEGWDEDAQATSDEERRCELIAAELPLTGVLRPAWDLDALAGLGVSTVRADEDAWLRLWSESEQSYYASSPMFMVEAVK